MDRSTRIFTEAPDGELIPMRPGAPASEDDLQDLIGRFPDIISADEGDLILVQREMGVPDAPEAADRWSLDHLFVTRSRIPVLVEVKRASDTRIRREVIGQLLDYAANGVVHWPAGALERAFLDTCAARGFAPAEMLEAFLGDQPATEFWQQVEANLAAGRMKLIVAADVVPPELARVIEFMNDQMRAEVRAVELRYFVSADGKRTLAPRFIGETEKSRVAKAPGASGPLEPISVETWIERRLLEKGPEVMEGARVFVEIIRSLGGEVMVAPSHASIRSVFVAQEGIKFRPLDLYAEGRVNIGFISLRNRPSLADERVRKEIVEEFSAAVGGISRQNLKGLPSFPVERLTDPQIATQVEKCAARLVQLASQAA